METTTKILVTGATGNVGSEVVRLLIESGQSVRAAVRKVEKARQTMGNQIECVKFDFKQPETYSAAFENVTKLFVVRPLDISNVKQHMVPAIEAARWAGVRQIVFLSLLGVEKNKVGHITKSNRQY